jgi:methylphosphotriester-DNA--protein-cysteine methyltransferase
LPARFCDDRKTALRYAAAVNLNTGQFNRLYRAFLRKDERLAGRAFIAVRTTGIYCLLTCRARTPRRENVTFYPSQVAAERAGFRPCRKCRPEVRGGRAAIERTTLRHWLARLAEEESGVKQLAAATGASPSRIYRMFRRNLGQGPRRARAQARLERACRLLREQRSTITEAAYAAGFPSLATFYRWFRRATGMTPREFRHRKSAGLRAQEQA